MERIIQHTNVLGIGISSIDMIGAVETLLSARSSAVFGYVCVTGVHGVIESQRDDELRNIHNNSFLTVPDGMPTVWMGREQGFTKMGRVYGPDLMLKVIEKTSALNQALGTRLAAIGDKSEGRHEVRMARGVRQQALEGDGLGGEDEGPGNTLSGKEESCTQCPEPNAQRPLTHFLYGATEEMLEKLKSNLEVKFPRVEIIGTYAPPFRPLNNMEEVELAELVAELKPDFFWVGLSTPKQERFMAAHADKPDFGIMLGVGAAFPIHAGLQKDAPEWIKNSGLQWFYRLCQDPKRLWRRYFDIVPTFLWLAFMQLLGVRKYSLEDDVGH